MEKYRNLDGSKKVYPSRIDEESLLNKLDRYTPEYKKWRKSVFERDEYTCQKCGRKGGILNAHHIKEWAKYPNYRFEIENGITLREDCHRAVHRKNVK